MSAETQLLVVGLAAAAMLALSAGVTFQLRSRQRRLVTESRRDLLAIMAQPGPAAKRLGQVQAFAADLGCDKVSDHRPLARGKQVTDESEVRGPEAEAPAATRDYAQLGDRVAAVLQAAEEAAQQIRVEARTAAEQMTRQAEQEARSVLEDSRSEAQRVRVEADTEAKNTREAVESYATNHRREAEEKAARVLSEAEKQARASREAAEAMSQQIEERARTLEDEVREHERMIRGRMQRYLAALRDVSGQIDEVLGETERGEQTLVEALDVEQAKQEA
jgi:type IV secretory pathway VirB10-like protein